MTHYRRKRTESSRLRLGFGLWLLSMVGLSMACNLLTGSPATRATQTALSAQQAGLLSTIAALTQTVGAGGASPAPPAGTDLPTLDPTAAEETLAALQTQLGPITPQPSDSGLSTPAPAAPADERLLKSAKILLFEDMSASRYIRVIQKALDEAGYFYLDVGSAKGWFKSQLLSDDDWDLIIAGAEAERDFGGEFYEYIDARLERGAAAIIENWDLDAAPTGRARALLDRCGVEVQDDWYMPDLPVFFWTDSTAPLFNQPNNLSGGLRNAAPIWSGDLGDLIQVKTRDGRPLGDAQVLAALSPNWKTDHGLLVSCLGGRMILQTFRTHQYDLEDMTALWQNYIYQALQRRLTSAHKSLPTPAVTYAAPQTPVAVTPPGATPGPDYTFPHPCGGALTARVLQAPVLTPDLFEHHASGVFLILRLEVQNTGLEAVQIWAGDYALESLVGQNKFVVPLHRPATGYLYLESPARLAQDLVQPGETWRTSLAFDINPASQGRVLILRPGSQFNQPVCQVSIPLDR